MTDDLRRRLEAVERAVADGETDLAAVADAAAVDERLAAVEERLDAVEERLAELDATTQALRGYLGGVDGVSDDVERQAALALAKAEAVEAAALDDDGLAVERLPDADATPGGGPSSPRTGAPSATDADSAARPSAAGDRGADGSRSARASPSAPGAEPRGGPPAPGAEAPADEPDGPDDGARARAERADGPPGETPTGAGDRVADGVGWPPDGARDADADDGDRSLVGRLRDAL